MKSSKINKLTLLILSFVFILSACNTAAEAETPEPIVDDYVPVVSATGEVVPERTALLSVSVGGVVAEVLVSEGEAVAAGQVLVRIEGEERLQAVLSAAQFELANAQYALNMLYDDTDLLAAQSLQAQDAAERALEDLLNPELQQALALEAIADTKKAVESAERRSTSVSSAADQSDIDAAKSQVVLARDALDKAEDDFKPYENKPEDNLARANFQARLAAAQQVYDAAVRKLNALQGTGSESDIAVAEADLATAHAHVSAAERQWERVKEGPNQADVALLEAQIVSAQRDHETYKDGPDPDDVAMAEARIDNAEAQLTAAEAALSDLELAAPFDGVVSELHINPSEWVAPGQPVLLLADLGHLRVETTDLGEIDVAQIEIGDTVIVSFDALPDAVVEGSITRIAPKASAGSGVNYTVIIELSQAPAQLRWGMTAFVDIEVE